MFLIPIMDKFPIEPKPLAFTEEQVLSHPFGFIRNIQDRMTENWHRVSKPIGPFVPIHFHRVFQRIVRYHNWEDEMPFDYQGVYSTGIELYLRLREGLSKHYARRPHHGILSVLRGWEEISFYLFTLYMQIVHHVTDDDSFPLLTQKAEDFVQTIGEDLLRLQDEWLLMGNNKLYRRSARGTNILFGNINLVEGPLANHFTEQPAEVRLFEIENEEEEEGS